MKTDHAAEVDRLQTTITEWEARYRERIKGWEDLQHRYEAQNNELHKIRKERDGLLEDKKTAETKAGKQEDEIMKLKDEKKQLKQDLQSARDDLKTEGGLKEELEVLREQNRKLSEDYAKLEKSVLYEKNQTESVRRAYQDASHHAGMLKNETTTLQDRVAYLQSQVDAEAVKLRELKTQKDESKHLARVKELEQALEVRENLLRKKEEELRNIRNNRPATRATSTQPRSPKAWGNNGSRPTSPGVNNGVGNRSSGLRFSSEMSL